MGRAGQGVLFYLYSPNLTALRAQLLANGRATGETVDGTPGPRQELKVTDPDGYVLMVAQTEPDFVEAEPDSPLHRKFGFTEVGTFREYGVKHGRYLSSLWMERLLKP